MKADIATIPNPEANTAGGPGGLADRSYRLGDDLSTLQNANIMMVDDESITMEVVQTFLEDAGYCRFLLVEDSTKAMAQLREHRPDVLLLDVVMPEVSGFDILKMLRSEEEFKHLPVIILTSSSDAATKLEALDLGATDFLSKPVDSSELSLRVRNTLAAKAYQDQLAYYDVLTNLPNRRLFHDRANWAIDKARRDGRRVAMLHVVFDNFKRVADAFGPSTGDEILKQVTQRLVAHVRSTDTMSFDSTGGRASAELFRLGSADFSVLLPEVDGLSSASVVARRMLQAMSEPLDADGTEVYLTPSIGIAGFPDDGDNTATLVKHAVGASSQAMAQGGGRLQFFSAELNEAALERLRIEADLRKALENGEFNLAYQPKISVATGKVVGAEALIRWRREDGTVVSPDRFIPVAEETGLILPIGEWVMREACRQIKSWRDQGIDLNLAINVSAKQFFHADIVGIAQSAMAESEVNPSSLMLEMTESLLMEHAESAIEIMHQLHDLGLSISIDDFGTGYSSLSYLKLFPMDEVKIDQSFLVDAVTSRQDQALVYVVTYLAHEFGFEVCAEGVENEAQLDLLRKIRCDKYQGYHFSRPLRPDEIAEMIRDF